jgi:hypothetical protein
MTNEVGKINADSTPNEHNGGHVISFLAMISAATFLFLLVAPKDPIFPGRVRTSEVMERPTELIGKTVTITSNPVKRVGLSSFTVSDKQIFDNRQLLVVNATDRPFNIPSDTATPILVTGELHNFKIQEIERKYNLDLDDQFYREYENQPVIVARSIGLAAER